MNIDFYRQIADPLKRMKELVKDLDNFDFETSLSSEEFSTAMHEALDSYDANCREAAEKYNEEFSRLCG